jgi:hypothetical protein
LQWLHPIFIVYSIAKQFFHFLLSAFSFRRRCCFGTAASTSKLRNERRRDTNTVFWNLLKWWFNLYFPEWHLKIVSISNVLEIVLDSYVQWVSLHSLSFRRRHLCGVRYTEITKFLFTVFKENLFLWVWNNYWRCIV